MLTLSVLTIFLASEIHLNMFPLFLISPIKIRNAIFVFLQVKNSNLDPHMNLSELKSDPIYLPLFSILFSFFSPISTM